MELEASVPRQTPQFQIHDWTDRVCRTLNPNQMTLTDEKQENRICNAINRFYMHAWLHAIMLYDVVYSEKTFFADVQIYLSYQNLIKEAVDFIAQQRSYKNRTCYMFVVCGV